MQDLQHMTLFCRNHDIHAHVLRIAVQRDVTSCLIDLGQSWESNNNLPHASKATFAKGYNVFYQIKIISVLHERKLKNGYL